MLMYACMNYDSLHSQFSSFDYFAQYATHTQYVLITYLFAVSMQWHRYKNAPARTHTYNSRSQSVRNIGIIATL